MDFKTTFLLRWRGMHPCLPFLRCCDLTTALLLQRLTYYCARFLLSIFLGLFCTSVHTTYLLTNLHTHTYTHTHNLQRGHQAVSPSAAVTSPRHQDAMGISTTISINCRGLQDHLSKFLLRWRGMHHATSRPSTLAYRDEACVCYTGTPACLFCAAVI